MSSIGTKDQTYHLPFWGETFQTIQHSLNYSPRYLSPPFLLKCPCVTRASPRFQSALDTTENSFGLFDHDVAVSVALSYDGFNCPAVWVESVISASSWLSCLCCWRLTLSKSLYLIRNDIRFRAETPQVPSAQTRHIQGSTNISGHLSEPAKDKKLRSVEVKASWSSIFFLQAAIIVAWSKLETWKRVWLDSGALNHFYQPLNSQEKRNKACTLWWEPEGRCG